MMDKIIGTVIMGMHRAAQYLGKICDVLRINSVLSYLHQDHDEASVLSSIYKNHVAQIEKERQECGYIFNKFITKKIIPGGTSIEPYEFDFTQDVEYEYRIPDNIWNEKKIDFMQRDNLITIPVNFIKSISVEREELYDV